MSMGLLPLRPAPMARPPVIGRSLGPGRSLGEAGGLPRPGRPWPDHRRPLALIFRRPANRPPAPMLRSVPGGPVQISLRFALTLHLAEQIRTVLGTQPTGSTATPAGATPIGPVTGAWGRRRRARSDQSAVVWPRTRWYRAGLDDQPIDGGWRAPAAGPMGAGPFRRSNRKVSTSEVTVPPRAVTGPASRMVGWSVPPTAKPASPPMPSSDRHQARWAWTPVATHQPGTDRTPRPGVPARDHGPGASHRHRARSTTLDLVSRSGTPATPSTPATPAGLARSEPGPAGRSSGRHLPVERVHRTTRPPVPTVGPIPAEVRAPAPSPPPVDLERLDRDLWKRFEKRIRIEQERRGRR